MFRPAIRAATTARSIPKAQRIGRRFASTAASKSGTWRGAALRWGAAGAIVYYYNTANVFAEEPQYAVHTAPETPHESETYRTVDSTAEQRRARARSTQTQRQPESPTTTEASISAPPASAEGPEALEEEAEQQGAFNEETGEINWDCPCLGGMAHGPCGEQFRAAFSCFVYSKEEPKGVECIEHFKTMQNCFREHPEIYGSEMDEEDVDAQLETQGQQGPGEAVPVSSEPQAAERAASRTEPAKQQEPLSESDSLVPKAWHDGRESTTAK
ncbi:Hypothetical predicted protein [Lecanosticta acicola]|uniref:Mitochondrial intermembrane space import and assembly protein 40 n=1 Tax=Lecanosticta acicola TaxID=111012 RepID=A0AAI8Z522_9PEZI|nr:Hypothetical predicted protein [Lecanosticta acicola]